MVEIISSNTNAICWRKAKLHKHRQTLECVQHETPIYDISAQLQNNSFLQHYGERLPESMQAVVAQSLMEIVQI